MPLTIMLLPVVFEDNAIAVIELATFHMLTKVQQDLLEQLTSALGVIIESVISRHRTEQLLKELQDLERII